jgi:thioredoxin-dependent peroxiredoxin
MADRNTTLRGNPMPLQGDALSAGQKAPDFTLTGVDMKPVTLAETAGSVRIVNVLPSLDTPVCDAQARRFNEEAVKDGKVKVLAISRDLPFAQKRWCAAAGVENVLTLSDYRDGSFGAAWGVMIDPLLIHSRAVFVLDPENNITYAEYVPEMSEHPNYEAALAAAKAAE